MTEIRHDFRVDVTTALPSGALPSGALPSGALPSGALPPGRGEGLVEIADPEAVGDHPHVVIGLPGGTY